MSWQGEVRGTDEFAAWYDDCSEADLDQIDAAVDKLQEVGPTLGRPFVDLIKGSRHHHMKELRPRGGNIRIFFAFDPVRDAILLCGGDKTGRFEAFYEERIEYADRLYDIHLTTLREEGRIE